MDITIQDFDITVETAENDLDITVNNSILEEALPIVTLSDAAVINVEFSDYQLRDFFIETVLSNITANIRGFGYAGILTFKKNIAGATTVKLQGDGLKFVDLENANSTVVSSLDVLIGGNQYGYSEIHLKDSGDTDSGERVILVIYR
jgi:hypothetical protein